MSFSPLKLFFLLAPLAFVAACYAPTHTQWNDRLLVRNAAAGPPTIVVQTLLDGEDSRHISDLLAEKLEAAGLRVERWVMDAQGSAFMISDAGLLVTAAHLVGPYDDITVVTTQKPIPAHVLFLDEEHDIAFAQLGEVPAGVRPIPLAGAEMRAVGQDVYAVGFPLSEALGNAGSLTKGVVSSDVGILGSPWQFQTSAQVQPGSSGGAILTADGHAVGLVSASLVRGQNVNFAVKAETIRDLLVAHQGEIAAFRIPSSTNTAASPTNPAASSPGETTNEVAPVPPPPSLQQSVAAVFKVTVGVPRPNTYFAEFAYRSSGGMYRGFQALVFALVDGSTNDVIMSQDYRDNARGSLQKSETVGVSDIVKQIMSRPLFAQSADRQASAQRAAQRESDRQILRQHEPQLRACLSVPGQNLGPSDDASIQIHFFVTASGFVRFPGAHVKRNVLASNEENKTAWKCMEQVVRSIRFAPVGNEPRFVFDRMELKAAPGR
jgi:S1-C subfamily serine protease